MKIYRLALLAGLLAAPIATLVLAQATTPLAAAEPLPPSEPAVEIPAEHLSARATLQTFLDAFYLSADASTPDPLARAAACLDLSQIPERVRARRGVELAVKLKDVLDRIERIDVEAVSADPEGEPWLLAVPGGGEVRIAPTAAGEWLFTRATVRTLPELYEQLADREVVAGIEVEAPRTLPLLLRSRIPESLRGGGFLIEPWQWLGLLVLALLGVLLDRSVSFWVKKGVAHQLGRRLGAEPGKALESALRPIGLLAAALVGWLGILQLDLPGGVLDVLLVAVRFITASVLVWTLYRIVDVVAAVLAARAETTASKFDDLLVPLMRKSLKIFVIAFGLVFVADSMQVQVTSLLAGLGIGGIAIALAAQDLVKNFFGSLMVIVDRPFHVGDWVVIGDVEGVVEEVGFRSTRIRSFYNSRVTLPNANLINTAVDNYGARRYRRWKTMLSLPYDTPPEKIEGFCAGVRELILRHPMTRKDSFQVYLNQFSGASLDVLLYMFFETPDWDTELSERHRLALDILRLAAELGIDFAFPTQTLYLRRGGAGTAAQGTLSATR